MTPVDLARTMYAKCGMDFQHELEYYLRTGFVFSTPTYFLMGRDEESHWFVQCAIGKGCLKKFMELMPYRRDFVIWYRFLKDKKVRIARTSDLERLIC